jgi:hypothetical protein
MTDTTPFLGIRIPRTSVRHLRWIVAIGATSALVGGGWFGWPWLVAAGVAPFLVAALPCLIMCGVMCAANLCTRSAPSHSTASDEQPAASSHNGNSISRPQTGARK